MTSVRTPLGLGDKESYAAARYTAKYDKAAFLEQTRMMYPTAAGNGVSAESKRTIRRSSYL